MILDEMRKNKNGGLVLLDNSRYRFSITIPTVTSWDARNGITTGKSSMNFALWIIVKKGIYPQSRILLSIQKNMKLRYMQRRDTISGKNHGLYISNDREDKVIYNHNMFVRRIKGRGEINDS